MAKYKIRRKKMYFFHTDHLGSTTYVTGREEVEQYSAYTPYGEPFVETRSVFPYKFNGKELDTETGLYYYGARYYNPATALWLGVDPLASKYPGVSPYVYCVSNPVKYVDPDGRDAKRRIERAKSFLNTPYKSPEPYELRTSESEEGLAFMDCSELVSRVMVADDLIRKDISYTSGDIVKLSKSEQYTTSGTPQTGDIFAWEGHTGIVESYNDSNNLVTVLHATSYNSRSKGSVRSVVRENYNISYFKKKNAIFLRPTNEKNTPNKGERNLRKNWANLIKSIKELRQTIQQFRDEN